MRALAWCIAWVLWQWRRLERAGVRLLFDTGPRLQERAPAPVLLLKTLNRREAHELCDAIDGHLIERTHSAWIDPLTQEYCFDYEYRVFSHAAHESEN